MILSMTGYGSGESNIDGVKASVEIRSVNSRFLEVNSRLPRALQTRENDIKEIVRQKVGRAKISISVSLDYESDGTLPLSVDKPVARSIHKLLNELRKTVKSREAVKLEHLLHFSEIFHTEEGEDASEKEWTAVAKALDQALDTFHTMRAKEGKELRLDFIKRLDLMNNAIDEIERISLTRIPEERKKLTERVKQIIGDEKIDPARIELEIVLLSDKLDVTEECVRFRSHSKFFTESLDGPEPAGRKLNFLVQEMNREINTIGSKSSDTEIAHSVVAMKEELERIREQLQNIE